MGNGIIKYLKYIINCVLDVVYCGSDRCIICGNYCTEELLCRECFLKIRFCKNDFKIKKQNREFDCCSMAYYSSIIAELIIRLKYKSDFRAGKFLADNMVRTIMEKKENYDLITFVPAGKTAYKLRGYNQSQYLAKKISEALGIPVYNCLKKVKDTKDQIGLDGVLRWANLLDSFKAVGNLQLKNKKILLIDDVITTGATAFYCALELNRLGAEKITILTAAKSSI